MGNENQGAWFLTRLAIIGSPIEVIQAAIPDLIEEIDARPHLRSHNLSWDADARHVCVEVENWGYDPEHAANGMAEELFEIAAAVLGDFEEFHVEILATDQKGSDLHSPDTD